MRRVHGTEKVSIHDMALNQTSKLVCKQMSPSTVHIPENPQIRTKVLPNVALTKAFLIMSESKI